MILPTMSEEQILQELIKDYKDVRKAAKKGAHKYMQKVPFETLNGKSLDDTMTSDNRNKWYCRIKFRKRGTSFWDALACCIVESDFGTKDYYIIRNFKENPYFIRLTSHTTRRMHERLYPNVKNYTPESLILASFDIPERGVAFPYKSFKEQLAIIDNDDKQSLSDNGYFVTFFFGSFLAKKTQHNNWNFQTFISTEMISKKIDEEHGENYVNRQGELCWLSLHALKNFNPQRWNELGMGDVDENEILKDLEWSRDTGNYFVLDP